MDVQIVTLTQFVPKLPFVSMLSLFIFIIYRRMLERTEMQGKVGIK